MSWSRCWGRKSSLILQGRSPLLAAAHSLTGLRANEIMPKTVVLQAESILKLEQFVVLTFDLILTYGNKLSVFLCFCLLSASESQMIIYEQHWTEKKSIDFRWRNLLIAHLHNILCIFTIKENFRHVMTWKTAEKKKKLTNFFSLKDAVQTFKSITLYYK